MGKIWTEPRWTEIPFKIEENMSDAELKMRLEESGYKFSKKFQVKEGYVHRRNADNDVLISAGDSNGYIELNASAAFLWDEMREPRMSGELEKSLERHFNLPHETAVKEVLDFLKELQKNGMVVIS